MPNVSLTTELEAFTESCIASGRYSNVSEVVRAGLRLLQDHEEQRKAFLLMLEEAERDAELHGWVTVDEMEAELDQIIARAESEHAARSGT